MAKQLPAKLIQQEDVDRIMSFAPDYILDATDDIKDLYVAAEWAKELRDLSPVRYFDAIIDEGTETERHVSIDFAQTVNVGAVIKTQGGDITLIRTANAKKLQYLRLDRAYQQAVLALNKARGIKSKKPRNIVDYTAPIMEMFGKFYTITDVAKVMAKEYRIKVPEAELKKFYVDNRDLITRRRAEYVLQNKDFRVATETGRLEVLNQMLIDIEIKNRAAGGTNVDYCNLIIKILEQARKEVKGDELKMTVDGRIDINATLQAEVNVMQTMRMLSINSLVIGLTAAKAGLDPAVLIGQLTHSWYAKFNGFSGNIMDGESVQLPSMLIKQYDWEQLEHKTKQFVSEFTPIDAIIDESDANRQAQAETRKKDILLRLKAAKNARAVEDARANPITPDSNDAQLKEDVAMLPAPASDAGPEPKHEFEIDYALNKKYKQPRGMRIKGAIKESVARHKAAKEEGDINVLKDEARRKRRAEARARRHAANRPAGPKNVVTRVKRDDV